MKRMNIIAVLDHTGDKMLMCLRRREPYKGMYNLVGGKIEAGEAGIDAAYRELLEETGLTRDDAELIHYADLTYYTWQIQLEVYFGRLNAPKNVYGEENDLYWIDMNENFFDTERFAGEGNIGHIVEELRAEGLAPKKKR